MSKKHCPGCNTDLPHEAFRKDKGRYDGLDSYCKGCRRQQTVENRPRENQRWNRHRKANAATYAAAKKARDPRKLKARYEAKKAFPNPKKCIITRCPNRGVRHHYLGYDPAHHTDILWLCPQHHALEHLFERARSRTGPTYFTTKHTNRFGSSKFRIGQRVVVAKVHKLAQHNPEVNKYVGHHGRVVQYLPNEWDLGRMYRVEFDDPSLTPLAFLARELRG